MIVPMQKATVLALDRDRNAALESMRKLGILHPEAVEKPTGPDLENTQRELQQLQKIVAELQRRAADGQGLKPARPPQEYDEDPAAFVGQTLRDLKNAMEQRGQTERTIRDIEPLGDFDPAAIRDLENRGVPVRIFRQRGKKLPAPSSTAVLHVLHETRSERIYAVIGDDNPILPEDQPVQIPARSLGDLRREQAAIVENITGLNRRLDDAVRFLPALRRALNEKSAALRFAETRAGMGQRERIVYLRGYVPAECLDALEADAQANGWGLLIEDPGAEDAVPTFIRHPGWVRPIRAVLNLMGILPGYREIDISAAFLLFFSLFFAMIVGDAGYGAIFLGLTLLARHRWGRLAPSEPFRLMTVLSLCTIGWGLLSGNVFGTSWFPTLIPWLEAPEGGPNQQNLMLLCFLIGAVHLTVAHAWNAIAIINTLQALAQVGWIGLTWFMFFLARSLILGAELPGWSYILLIGGLILVVVFMTPRRLLKTEWVSHAMLPLTVINNFVDVVSYVRLFAVGFASLAVAQAFNNMAAGAGGSGFSGGLVKALILFGGHALNIVLCLLSVMVHGIRLNTLEFSSHIGMQWTGFAYRPLADESVPERATTPAPGM